MLRGNGIQFVIPYLNEPILILPLRILLWYHCFVRMRNRTFLHVLQDGGSGKRERSASVLARIAITDTFKA